ncbi:MAG: glycosyltransferase family 4 protein [Porphyrobacter sp.]|nr:glycosyltransferase family 4 protein [Porphyrobacter sp.]
MPGLGRALNRCRTMRILISDYSGHPFQVQLSRELARRGHWVTHTYSAGFQTPKGNLAVGEGDPEGFSIVPVNTSKPFAKNSFFTRRNQEIEIGHRLAELVEAVAPEVVISSNAPLDTQRVFQAAAKRRGAGFVFWLQDIYSEAIGRVIPRKFPVVGSIVAARYRNLEFRMLRESDHVVAITADFVPILAAKGVDEDKITVIENWAPLDELPRHPRDNAWAEENMSGDAVRIVYSGTLGYKHNPALLKALAAELPQAHVHVFSQGEVADRLAAEAAADGIANLSVHPWVPFSDLPLMLSGSDIFVVVIEPEAGVYSVPSKVLTYLGIGRPILASVPLENLAARLILENEAGFVSPPGEDRFLIEKAKALADPAQREQLGDNGRAYASRQFDVASIATRFETVIAKAGTGTR